MPDDPATSDRLRHDIDRGRAGDKVPFTDPAAAPLGTDDEAAGTPPTPEQIRMARKAELRGVSARDNAPARPSTPGDLVGNGQRRQMRLVAGLALVAMLLAIAVLAF